jgi:peptide methionine sulfoxide reductase MsrA
MIISFDDILNHFFQQLGASLYYPSGNVQYRSAILYHTEEQKQKVLTKLEEFKLKLKGNRSIHLDLEKATDFYRAEEYHQKYFEKNNYSCCG